MSAKLYHYQCTECGIIKTYLLEEADVQRWREGALIQRVFPQIEDREIMISGICSACFNKMFGGEDEQDVA